MTVRVDASGTVTTSMSITEVGGPTDPLGPLGPSDVKSYPVTSPDPELRIWTQRDPLSQVTHVTGEYRGMQATVSITDALIDLAQDPRAVIEAATMQLMTDLNHPEVRKTALKALPLSYWRRLVEQAIDKHLEVFDEAPRRCNISVEAYSLISQAVDDLPGTVIQKKRRLGMAPRMVALLPKDMPWSAERPQEGAALISIRVK